jgi:hypothetical protein
LLCMDGTTDTGHASSMLTEVKSKITNSISIL